MQTRQQLDDHVKSCTEASNRTYAALKDLAQGLSESGKDRTKQFDRLNGMMWKVVLWLIGGLLTAAGAILLPAIHLHIGN